MRRHQGFTLMEIMIAVAIVAILTAIALPNYSAYVIRSKITEPTSELANMRVKMEQYFQDNRTYVGACVSTTIAPLPTPSNPNFDYTCPTLTLSSYGITATGKAGGPMAGFTYNIDQDNVRTSLGPSGWAATSGNCWIQRKDGSC